MANFVTTYKLTDDALRSLRRRLDNGKRLGAIAEFRLEPTEFPDVARVEIQWPAPAPASFAESILAASIADHAEASA